MPYRHRHRNNPAVWILGGFLAALFVGTGLLMLPFSTTHAGGLPLLPALFTATSALCVTGLSAVDTATYWTTTGHVVILALIQIGGFGVMSFATFLGLFVTRRARLSADIVIATERRSTIGRARPILTRVFLTSLGIEAVIACALLLRFLSLGYSLGKAAWYGVFHAVSAFNNAGFALFTGNMERFVTDWGICLPIMCAIILGGLGFPVLFQLRRDLWHYYKWSLHVRMVVIGTGFLLVFSTVLILAAEWNNPDTLGGLPLHAKFLAGAFQAVQTRTAGFSSIDIGQMHDSTLLAMDVFMFIGGGPAGTAGGIKITTALVLVALVTAEVRASRQVNIFGKSFAPDVYREAITVITLSGAVVVTACFALLVCTDFPLDAVLFEATSAFGTVGLSTGITSLLPGVAQIIIISLMIFGRLGPITVATALASHPNESSISLPKERPIIG
ncbi:ATPase [Actinobaculum suis]|nr:ATPase [Actinobaculum suis]OCA94850.1 ATPase [Actinobaculum suis]OCA95438.1 ATPase [Actinobaculum suis]